MVRVLFVLAAVVAVALGSNIRWPAPKLDGRIVGGHDTTVEEYPYQISLQNFGYHNCGASIISANWALTAAHCVYRADPREITFRAGTSTQGKGGSIHIAAEIFTHPKYDSWTTDYDFALVRVNEPFPIGEAGVNIITLASAEPAAGTETVVTGWGALSSGGGSPSQLQSVEVPIVDRATCEKQYADYTITDRMICAGLVEGGKDACQGDSGGPLVAVNGAQVGIVSWGVGCAYPNYAGIYSSVAWARDWIKEVSGV